MDEVVEAINTYLTLMTDAVLDHGVDCSSTSGRRRHGGVRRPVANDDHADLALAAARAMAGEQLATFNAWLERIRREPPAPGWDGSLKGPVLSASVGSPRRLDYTVIGDTVNTAYTDRMADEGPESRDAVLERTKTRSTKGRRTRPARRARSEAGAARSASGPSTSRNPNDLTPPTPRSARSATASSRRVRPADRRARDGTTARRDPVRGHAGARQDAEPAGDVRDDPR